MSRRCVAFARFREVDSTRVLIMIVRGIRLRGTGWYEGHT